MKDLYKSEWLGSEVAEVKSGIAKFECAGEMIEVHLDGFDDFQNICEIIDLVMEQTYYKTKIQLHNKIDNLLK